MKRQNQHTRGRIRKKRRSGRRPPKNRHVAPRTKRQAQARNRAFRALGRVRRGASFSAAARAEHINPRTVLKYVGMHLRRRRGKGGKIRYVPVKSDRTVLNLFVITEFGYQSTPVRSSQAASLLGKHAAAVLKFLRNKGDSSVLAAFRGKRVAGRKLITDPQLLLTLARAGALRLDDLYAVPTGAA